MIKRIIASGYTDGYIVGLEGRTGNRGISVYEFDTETNALTLVGDTDRSENPSFLHLGESGITVVCERADTCYVEGYRFLPEGGLEKNGSVAVPGTAMCHIALWPGGRFASVSNYMTGSFAVIRMDGSRPVELVSLTRHSGVGFLSDGRQEGPHVHQTQVSPGGGYLLAADLGLDQVFVYKIDTKTGAVELLPESAQLHTPPGTGPRHMAFSPDGRHMYLVTEMGCRLYAYSWDETAPRFTLLQEISLLPEGFDGLNLSADIHLSPDGSRVYASNRGADDIAVFARDGRSGLCVPFSRRKLDGRGPRNFCLEASMNYLAAACQSSGELLIYSLEPDGGIGPLLARAPSPQASFCTFQ